MESRIVNLIASLSRALPDVRGRGRLANWCFEHLATAGEWSVTMRRGHEMCVPRSVRQGWAAAFCGAYDDREFELVRDLIEPGSSVLDIGASVGYWTLNLALYTEAGVVHAFEPIANNVRILKENLRRNSVDSVEVHPFGLGSSTGSLAALVERGGSGNAAVLPPQSNDGSNRWWETESTTIDLRRLDDLKLSGRRCSFIKMDVEGYELQVLRGAEYFISANNPIIFGEFDPIWMAARNTSRRALFDWAHGSGYSALTMIPRRERFAMAPRGVELIPVVDVGLRPSQAGPILLVPRGGVSEHFVW